MMNKELDINTLVRTNILNLEPYSSARDAYKTDREHLIFLDANENPFENGVNRYPDPQQQSVKNLLATQKGLSASQILLGNGSDEVLDLLFRAFCEPAVDAIITLPPTYGMYGVLAEINNVGNKQVLLTENFELDIPAILKMQNKNCKLLFICSPNNPTGNVFNKDAIELLLRNFNGLVIIDEAYIDFAESESWVSVLDEFPNLVVIQTLSKAYGMAGIRLGVCYASDAIITVLNKIKPPYNVNELTQQRAMIRLQNISEVKEQVAKITNEKNVLYKALLQVSCIDKIYPSEANFILIRVDNASMRYKQLCELGIVVRNRSNQPRCENTLRLTVGTAKENKQLIQALKEISK